MATKRPTKLHRTKSGRKGVKSRLMNAASGRAQLDTACNGQRGRIFLPTASIYGHGNPITTNLAGGMLSCDLIESYQSEGEGRFNVDGSDNIDSLSQSRSSWGSSQFSGSSPGSTNVIRSQKSDVTLGNDEETERIMGSGGSTELSPLRVGRAVSTAGEGNPAERHHASMEAGASVNILQPLRYTSHLREPTRGISSGAQPLISGQGSQLLGIQNAVVGDYGDSLSSAASGANVAASALPVSPKAKAHDGRRKATQPVRNENNAKDPIYINAPYGTQEGDLLGYQCEEMVLNHLTQTSDNDSELAREFQSGWEETDVTVECSGLCRGQSFTLEVLCHSERTYRCNEIDASYLDLHIHSGVTRHDSLQHPKRLMKKYPQRSVRHSARRAFARDNKELFQPVSPRSCRECARDSCRHCHDASTNQRGLEDYGQVLGSENTSTMAFHGSASVGSELMSSKASPSSARSRDDQPHGEVMPVSSHVAEGSGTLPPSTEKWSEASCTSMGDEYILVSARSLAHHVSCRDHPNSARVYHELDSEHCSMVQTENTSTVGFHHMVELESSLAMHTEASMSHCLSMVEPEDDHAAFHVGGPFSVFSFPQSSYYDRLRDLTTTIYGRMFDVQRIYNDIQGAMSPQVAPAAPVEESEAMPPSEPTGLIDMIEIPYMESEATSHRAPVASYRGPPRGRVLFYGLHGPNYQYVRTLVHPEFRNNQMCHVTPQELGFRTERSLNTSLNAKSEIIIRPPRGLGNPVVFRGNMAKSMLCQQDYIANTVMQINWGLNKHRLKRREQCWSCCSVS